MNSLSNVRKIREHARNAAKVTREIDVLRDLAGILELTYIIEIALNSVKSGVER